MIWFVAVSCGQICDKGPEYAHNPILVKVAANFGMVAQLQYFSQTENIQKQAGF